MKKFCMIFVLVFLLTAAALLGGCGQNGSDSPDPASAAGQEPSSAFSSEIPEDPAGVINIFVPSAMTLSMNDLIETYSRDGGGRVVANYSDAASLAGQIRENADCDIFICDDPALLDQLAQEGYLQEDTRAALSGREVVLTAHAEDEENRNAESFYEFLLSEQAQNIMAESFDSTVPQSTDAQTSAESVSAS